MFLKNVGDHISGKYISLVVEALLPEDEIKGYVPAYVFGIVRHGTWDRVGRISLRIGNNELINRYAGHIGYSVDKPYRGNGYAGKACALLVELAKSHEFATLYITCDPDNYASKRTIEKLGAQLIDVVNVPRETEIYKRGERIKLRYAWDI